MLWGTEERLESLHSRVPFCAMGAGEEEMGKQCISKLLLSHLEQWVFPTAALPSRGIRQLPEFPAAAMICFTLGLTDSVQMQTKSLI